MTSQLPLAQQAKDEGTAGHPEAAECSWDAGRRLGRSGNALSGASDLVRQKQTGQHVLPLPAHPMGLGTWGQQAQMGLSSQGRWQLSALATTMADAEQLRRAKLHVEKAIKVRGLISHRPETPRASIFAAVAQES